VQGVGFRMNARAEALGLGLSGSARNLADGSVEVLVEGEEESVQQLIDWLRVGPRFASVAGVEISDLAESGFTGFEVG
jgi:acylphosphatase